MLYQKNCPLCGHELDNDDIDYSFPGCQDEYSICPKCNNSFLIKVRYGHPWKADYHQVKPLGDGYYEAIEGTEKTLYLNTKERR